VVKVGDIVWVTTNFSERGQRISNFTELPAYGEVINTYAHKGNIAVRIGIVSQIITDYQ
jgi:hypothetical protein